MLDRGEQPSAFSFQPSAFRGVRKARFSAVHLLSMTRARLGMLGGIALAVSCIAFAQSPNSHPDPLRQGFLNPPPDARPIMRWWWFGPAVTKPELARELQTMNQAGIGGVEIQPVYPMALDDPAKGIENLRYLSPEFLAM